MYEQRRIRVPAPRVGLGAFGIGIFISFVAGGLAVSLLVGGHGALSQAASNTIAVPQAGTPVVASPTLRRELLVDDFAPGGQAATSAAVPMPLRRELLVDDFAPSWTRR